ncbi:MAG: glycosyltransferase family 87 protein [Chitinophagaceae bacterium]
MRKLFTPVLGPNYVMALWFIIPLVASIIGALQGPSYYNNFLIFKQVFWHTLEQKNLYLAYPSEYLDKNHYGPLFSILIAPFALLPIKLGVIFWAMTNVAILFYAIQQLPLSTWGKKTILLIALIETLTSVQNVQFNPMLTAWIVLAYVFTKRNHTLLATAFIVAGMLVKIYGIVGFAFIFFSNDYKKFITYSLMWSVVFFVAPMILADPEFIVQSYVDWYNSLVEKNEENLSTYLFTGMQDISFMGFVRRVSGLYTLPNWYFLIPAAILSLIPLLRFSQHAETSFQLTYLAQLLIGLVIFSSSAESPTYVIAVTGFAIWYVLQGPTPPLHIYLLLFLLLILTVFSPTDLFPRYIRENYVIKYSLKALPCMIAWLKISWQLITKDHRTKAYG